MPNATLVRNASPTHDEEREPLWLVWWLRNIAIVTQTAFLAAAIAWLHLSVMLWLPGCIIGALMLGNLLTWVRLRRGNMIRDPEFFVQLLLDMVSLALLLYCTGGASNPFSSLFILQVAIAAVALPMRLSWAAALVAIGLYTLLMLFHKSLPAMAGHAHDATFFTLHVQGMWVNFILLAVLIPYFVARMHRVLRAQDARLAEANGLAMLGTLAATAAHALGTPLGTLLLLAEQYGEEAAGREAQERAGLLKAEIMRCKGLLAGISAASGTPRAGSGGQMTLDAFFDAVFTDWQARHPAVTLTVTMQPQDAPPILAEPGVAQMLFTLLDNAAEAGATLLDVYATWTPHAARVRLCDNGVGLSADALAGLGTPGLSTKKGGLGMGVYLARQLITRLGGALTFAVRDDGVSGLIAELTLPLDMLAV